jgi:precorrin-6B methylase 2
MLSDHRWLDTTLRAYFFGAARQTSPLHVRLPNNEFRAAVARVVLTNALPSARRAFLGLIEGLPHGYADGQVLIPHILAEAARFGDFVPRLVVEVLEPYAAVYELFESCARSLTPEVVGRLLGDASPALTAAIARADPESVAAAVGARPELVKPFIRAAASGDVSALSVVEAVAVHAPEALADVCEASIIADGADVAHASRLIVKFLRASKDGRLPADKCAEEFVALTVRAAKLRDLVDVMAEVDGIANSDDFAVVLRSGNVLQRILAMEPDETIELEGFITIAATILDENCDEETRADARIAAERHPDAPLQKFVLELTTNAR